MSTIIFNADGTRTPIAGPVPPVPSEVTNFQARAALRRAGLLNAVNTAVAAAGGEALDAWEYANFLYRTGVLVQTMAAGLGLTPAQIDNLFRQAAAIEA